MTKEKALEKIKVAFVAENDITTTTLFKVIMGEITPDTGTGK